MDFGRLADHEFPLVDFTLPPDSGLTTKILKAEEKPDKPDLYIGCAKWGRKEWVGMIYPPKTKEADFLTQYVKHFNSIELNALFYGMPKKEQLSVWRERAEAYRTDFKFFPKFSQSISHLKRLKNAEELTTQYLAGISALGNTLGPAFLQLSDNFGPKNFDILKNYLEELPNDYDVFVELRHKDWFSDISARNELFEMMHSIGKGSIITDASGRRDCLHMELTSSAAFIRFVGNGLHPTDFSRIDAWAERLADWKDQGLKKIYFFLHQHDEKDTPVLADYTIRKFNEKLETNIPRPVFIKSNTGLFS